MDNTNQNTNENKILTSVEHTIQTILNLIFRFAYPIGFIGAIMYSITSIITIDFFSVIFNKNIMMILNIYVGFCGYIAFCTFFKIQIEIGKYVIDFNNIYIAYDKNNNFITNSSYFIAPSQIQVSLT